MARVELMPPSWNRGAEDDDETPHGLLSATGFPEGGEADAVHAATALDWCRRLDEADDLRRCLAFDQITARDAGDLAHLVGFHPWKRRKLPGARTVWQVPERPNCTIPVRDAIGAGRHKQGCLLMFWSLKD